MNPVEAGDGGSLAAVVELDGGDLAAARDEGGRLDQDAPEPLWQQLAGLLRARIVRGELTGRLEAETTMAQHYQVSRDTVRRALAELREEGLIQATRGRGTFVIRLSERGS